MQEFLKNSLVAEKVCKVDNSDLKTLENPYSSVPTATVSGITGTYAIGNWSSTNDTLTVDQQVTISEHVYGFEDILAHADTYQDRMEKHMYAVSLAIDLFVINNLLEEGSGTYSTPSGGFTTASNVLTIMANLGSKFGGYANPFNKPFLIIENTDMVGFTLAGATNGYSFADSYLNNGYIGQPFMGFEVYVVRAATFSDETASSVSGTTTWTNLGHRVAGLTGIATYASPRSIQYEEKTVSGQLGKEIVTSALIGFKLWNNMKALIIDITLTA
jgi:hypothetical protein